MENEFLDNFEVVETKEVKNPKVEAAAAVAQIAGAKLKTQIEKNIHRIIVFVSGSVLFIWSYCIATAYDENIRYLLWAFLMVYFYPSIEKQVLKVVRKFSKN